MKWFESQLVRLRARLPPKVRERSGSVWNLFYLLFLFFNWNRSPLAHWLPQTVLSIALFLPIFFHAYTQRGRAILVHAAAIAALGFALTPFNSGANTYLIYAGVLLPFSGIALRSSIAIIAAGLAAYSTELMVLGYPSQYLAMSITITAIVSVAICAANHFHREKELRQAELKLSHDEIRRLASLAERERIGRDLHDLLGHTLSLITLKSELAMRLFDRDPLAARREIADVERVARDALGQVRSAVSGIRTAGLAAELASARLLLESVDVHLDYALGELALPPEIETVLALTLREAITNVQRHARATHVRVQVEIEGADVRLRVIDDGTGARIVPGNGVAGMRERVTMLGGELHIESTRGKGTRLCVSLPLPPMTTFADARLHEA
ncbi:MAG: sensor histidine kinase [Dokdonella sp.]